MIQKKETPRKSIGEVVPPAMLDAALRLFNKKGSAADRRAVNAYAAAQRTYDTARAKLSRICRMRGGASRSAERFECVVTMRLAVKSMRAAERMLVL